jgi:hypothetical protein
MVGMYVPRLLDGSMVFRLLLLVASAVVLVAYLRKRHRAVSAIVFVLGGWFIAILPGTLRAMSADLSGYGDVCREWNHVDLPDWVFSVYIYFDVRSGTPMSLLGMLCGAVLLTLGGYVVRRFFIRDGQKGTAELDGSNLRGTVSSH